MGMASRGLLAVATARARPAQKGALGGSGTERIRIQWRRLAGELSSW